MFRRCSRSASGLVLCALLTSPALAESPIKIGVPVGLSGANSVVAPSVVQSAELAVEEINKAGGVLGRTLALEVADDGSGAAGAQKAFDSRRPAAGSAWKNPLHLHLVL
jgi:urea transport system substrate-binding protein